MHMKEHAHGGDIYAEGHTHGGDICTYEETYNSRMRDMNVA